jgi:nitroreductase
MLTPHPDRQVSRRCKTDPFGWRIRRRGMPNQGAFPAIISGMNSTIQLLMQRKSVRAYDPRPLDVEQKEAILQAAMRAPTAGNMMLYTILEVEDPALKERLAETCDNQPFIARSPYLLLFLADYQRWYDYYRAAGVSELCAARGETMRHLEEGDLVLAMCDTLIAAQTAVVAAESLGIGSCYIGDIIENYEIHRELFGLPPYVMPVTLVCFGTPTPEAAARRLTPRFERRFIVQRDRYQRATPADLEVMFQSRNDQLNANPNRSGEIQNVGQFNYVRKFSADFSIEMSRSVRAMLKTWTEE